VNTPRPSSSSISPFPISRKKVLQAQLKPWRFYLICAGLLLFLFCLTSISLLWGSAALTSNELFNALMQVSPESSQHKVIWNLRLPRTLLAIVIGIHFALSGLILQSVIRNPLADPSVIGVSGGASLAIVIFLLLADAISGALSSGEITRVSLAWLPLAAFIGGLLVAVFVLSLSWRSAISPTTLALNGIAVGAVLNALVMWAIVAWGGSRTETSIIWLAGSLYGRDFHHLIAIIPWTTLGLIATFAILKPLSILRFNEDLAQSLGLNIVYWRVIAIIIAVALAASAIAVAGPVGFVGLIVPHMARLLVGSQMVHLTVISILGGASLTLGADIIGRLALSPLEIPVGALTTLIGIPVLLILLQRQKWNTL
jgi:iron complex transport system permease protein